MTDCRLCGEPEAEVVDLDGGTHELRCRNCGVHRVASSAWVGLGGNGLTEVDRARLAHGVVHQSDTLLTSTLARDVLANTVLPPADEQIDNLVLHLASTLRPGEQTTLLARALKAKLGAVTDNEARWVLDEALRAGWLGAPQGVTSSPDGWALADTTLTIKGWQRHAELMKSGARSRHAFMAMKFGDAGLDALYRDHLRPAVAATGFDLRTTNESQKTAGSIDNRMRVEIRTSRFVVCDLSHGNRGAYWEAGFAEGLGRPVFYVCRRDRLQSTDAETRPHFDTAHQLIIGWDLADPASAMQELKDAIRATLPDEARLADE